MDEMRISFSPYEILKLVENDPADAKGSASEWMLQNTDQLRSYQHWIDDKGIFCRTLLCEIALRQWYPPNIDGEDTLLWWNQHIKDPDVTEEFPPVWRCLEGRTLFQADTDCCSGGTV